MAEFNVLGKNHIRVDAFDKVTGHATYAGDVYLPEMLMCKVLTSPRSHARIVNIDTSEAQALPGVRGVITGQDFPDVYFGSGALRDRRVMARDEVFYVMERATALGVRKVIVTHPCYDPPAIAAPELAELAAAGAYIELSFILVDMGLVSFEETAAIFRHVGAGRTILSTDVGQVDRVAPAEGLAKLGAGLLAEEISRGDIDTAMKHNPRFLVSSP